MSVYANICRRINATDLFSRIVCYNTLLSPFSLVDWPILYVSVRFWTPFLERDKLTPLYIAIAAVIVLHAISEILVYVTRNKYALGLSTLFRLLSLMVLFWCLYQDGQAERQHGDNYGIFLKGLSAIGIFLLAINGMIYWRLMRNPSLSLRDPESAKFVQ
jgi:peptidoglycan biosynthesis protein MviN/MurJ (putative lipid II flippase)